MTRLLPTVGLLALAACGAADTADVHVAQRPLVNAEASPFSMVPAAGALVVDLPGDYRVFCSGVLIGDSLVLTAAHCFGSLPAGTPLGFYNGISIQPSDPSPPVAPVVSVHPSPKFEGGAAPKWIDNYNDIALVKLQVNPAVKPARLVRPGEVSGLVKSGAGVMLVGYGHTLPGVKTTAGTKHHGVSTVGEVGTHELHVIGAGAPQKCHGDSGGPTLGDLDATGGYDFRVIGVTSRADEFCSAGSIETRVDAHLDWIHSVGGSAIPCGSGKNPDCPAPPKKGLGDPCDRHDECEGALCVPLEEGSVCSQRCALQQAGACPAGFNCVPIVGASDGACVAAPPPPKKKLLEGCTLGEECEAGLCGFMRGERFCTVSCDPQTGGACPEAAIELVCIRAENGPHACVPRQLTEIEEESGCSCGGRPAGATGLMLLLAVSFLLQSIYPGRRC